jgi:tetratricopeptide (TPR) repeat protein
MGIVAGCFGTCGLRLLAGMALALFALAGVRADDCTHTPLARLPLIPNDDGTPVVSLRLDGMQRNVLLDTGGFWSLIDPAITRFYPHHRSKVVGQLGLQGIPLTRAVTVPSIEIGSEKVSDVDFFEEPSDYIPTAATLGANWLSRWDVEIDPAAGQASFFPPSHCRDAIMSWPHSDSAVLPVRIDRRERLVTIPLELDGRTLNALIDTGSPETFLSARAAKALFGIEGAASSTEAGIDRAGRPREVYRRRFHALKMGDIVFNDPWLVIAPMAGHDLDMILGMHDLASLHLYFAYGEQKLYASTIRGDMAARQDRAPAAAVTGGAIALTNARDYLLSAEDALKRRDYDGAKIALDAAVLADPGGIEAYLERAELFSLEGRRVQAFDDVNRAMAVAPKKALSFVVRSELYILAGDADHALADASAAIALDPKMETAYAARAEAYAVKGEWEHAMQDSTAAIRTAPRSVTGYLSRSRIYELAGDYTHALEDADQAVRLQPKSATALNARCWNGAILARLDMALDDCNAAVALRPYSAEILDSRAFVNFQAGKYDLAQADYDAALAINPRLASSLYGRGLARQKKGDPAAGRADIAAARAIDPQIVQTFGK